MPWRRQRVVSGALAAVLALVARSEGARAATTGDQSALAPLAIPVELRACPDVDRLELQKLLAIEYQTLGVEPRSDSERVVVACNGERAQLTLEPSGRSNRVELSSTTASAWPRLLALAVSELVIEARARIPAVTVATSAPAKRSAVAPVAAKPHPVLFRLFAGAHGQWVPHAASSLWGPELGLASDAFFPATIEVRAHAGFGSTNGDLARVRWTAEGGSVAVRWDVRFGRFTGGVGPGFSLDALQLSPSVKVATARGERVSGPWGGPELDVHGSFALGSTLLVYARIDAGLLGLPLRGDASDGRRLVDASGTWVGAALGAAAQF